MVYKCHPDDASDLISEAKEMAVDFVKLAFDTLANAQENLAKAIESDDPKLIHDAAECVNNAWRIYRKATEHRSQVTVKSFFMEADNEHYARERKQRQQQRQRRSIASVD